MTQIVLLDARLNDPCKVFVEIRVAVGNVFLTNLTNKIVFAATVGVAHDCAAIRRTVIVCDTDAMTIIGVVIIVVVGRLIDGVGGLFFFCVGIEAPGLGGRCDKHIRSLLLLLLRVARV